MATARVRHITRGAMGSKCHVIKELDAPVDAGGSRVCVRYLDHDVFATTGSRGFANLRLIGGRVDRQTGNQIGE